MHEFSIMESALVSAQQQTVSSGAKQIHRLKLRVGKISGVVPASLYLAFDALKSETLAAEAILEVEEVGVTCWCSRCTSEFESADLKYECPRCHHPSGDLRRGKELELASLEIS
ncbi:MAG TPA: hydrogenase maturation nickel metallochaperone HypA [Verrucomicrobiae bacterium]